MVSAKDGTEIYLRYIYPKTGKARYPTVILCSPWTVTAEIYIVGQLVQKFADRGYLVAMLTNRGFYKSGGEADLAGVRLGRISDIPENDRPFGQNEEEIAQYWCRRAGVKYLGRADIGHDGENKIVPFGAIPSFAAS